MSFERKNWARWSLSQTGKKFGRLTLGEVSEIRNHNVKYHAICECGRICQVFLNNVCGTHPRQKACGQCLKRKPENTLRKEYKYLYIMFCDMKRERGTEFATFEQFFAFVQSCIGDKLTPTRRGIRFNRRKIGKLHSTANTFITLQTDGHAVEYAIAL